jgi:hypothetical protein
VILPPQHELFVSDRPVRSDYSRERVYARRRIVTVIVLCLMLAGGAYVLWGRGPSNPADIPTIKAEGSYKQKPAEPGGIDIPHQDVRVYDQLENNKDAASPVEHLLPPPEAPKEIPHAESAPVQTLAPIPAPVSEPSVASVPSAAPIAAVAVTPKTDILPGESVAKPVNTTVAAVSVSTPAVPAATPQLQSAPAPKAAPLSIEQVINNTSPKPTAAVVPSPIVAAPAASLPSTKASSAVTGTTGKGALQLASLPGEAQATDMMAKLQKKYAVQLRDAKLHVARADLGSRGVYYRIQSQVLAEGEAARICASLKQLNAGCIIVGK